MAPLFLGFDFFVAANVPMRDRWIDLISDHGGVVISSVNQNPRCIYIADDLRKRGVPENAVSWKFIEQSVKKGKLDEIDKYRIRDNQDPKPAGPKGRRTKFSAEDDQILADWLAKMEREGEATGGNKVFERLEKICPRHTRQSWQARAKSYRQLLPRPRPSTPEMFKQRIAEDQPAADEEPAPSPPASSRPGNGQGGSTRVKFTKDDDDLLIKYVQEAAPNQRSGYEIYKALAEEHPHHTHNSWRDRYVKILKPQLETEAANGGGSLLLLPSPPRQTRQIRQTTDEDSALPRPRTEPSEVRPTSAFTRAAAHPVAPSDGASPDIAAGRKADSHSAIARTGRPTALPPPRTPTHRSQAMPFSRPSARSAGGSTLAEALDRAHAQKRKEQAAIVLQRHWRGHRVRSALLELDRNLSIIQAHARGAAVRREILIWKNALLNQFTHIIPLQAHTRGALVRHAVGPFGAGEDDVRESDQAPPEELVASKEEFHTLFSQYMDITDAKIKLWPTVLGRTLELWDLWRTVKSLDQSRPPSMRNWEHIAEALGFDWCEKPEVTQLLERCYEENLGNFEDFLQDFAACDPGSEVEAEEELQEETFAQLGADMEAVEQDADPEDEQEEKDFASESVPFQSSPPRIQRQKRAYEPEPSVDLGFSPHKRMRHTKDTEIPSTPQQKAGAASSRWQEELTVSSHRKKAAVTASIEEPHLPQMRRPRPANARLEPETQDFGFDNNGFHSQPEDESELDTSPSQQLRLESEQIDPIPFSGFGKTDDGRNGVSGSHHSPYSSAHRVVPDSAAGRGNTGIRHSIETPVDEQDDDATPKPRQARQRASESPVEKAKRRSLPASFHRVVSPPNAKAASTTTSRPPVPSSSSRSKAPPAPPAAARHSTSATATASTRARPKPKVPPPGLQPKEQLEFYQSLGYDKKHIQQAFVATMGLGGLAAQVMEELRAGRGVPADWPGVWTDTDDRHLRYVVRAEETLAEAKRRGTEGRRDMVAMKEKARRYRAGLERKHGRVKVEARKREV